uniref:Amidophosphoribosyltransferase n=1 Tax=Bombyx mori TaxID=7091 RepID=A0A8R2R448_BOMMO|nr:amidophosphoribosyltransferase isoform X2 [Bombyx mori]
MDGPAGPSPCQNEQRMNSEAMKRLGADDSGCHCDRTQPEVKIKSKRYGRGAVESGLTHECGVFGAIGTGKWPTQVDIPQVICLGLVALQHRGQESAGIVTSEGVSARTFNSHKGMGLINNIFNDEAMKNLKGNLGIGHTRYSTSAASEEVNCQPFVVHTAHGALAVAHNGELVNCSSLRRMVLGRGVGLSTHSDSELITQALCLNPPEGESDGPDWPARINHLMRLAPLSYSLVIMLKDKIYAVRDPYGNRPLCLGKILPLGSSFLMNGCAKNGVDDRAEGWVVSSESCGFLSIGARYVREVLPGEIVEMSSHGIRTVDVVERPAGNHQAFCIFEYVYFARADSMFEGQMVYSARMQCGRMLARESAVDADIVSSVPESGTAAAHGYARQVHPHSVRRHYRRALTARRTPTSCPPCPSPARRPRTATHDRYTRTLCAGTTDAHSQRGGRRHRVLRARVRHGGRARLRTTGTPALCAPALQTRTHSAADADIVSSVPESGTAAAHGYARQVHPHSVRWHYRRALTARRTLTSCPPCPSPARRPRTATHDRYTRTLCAGTTDAHSQRGGRRHRVLRARVRHGGRARLRTTGTPALCAPALQTRTHSAADADIVSSVPESGTAAAHGYARQSGIPFMEVLCKNRYVGRTFIQPSTRLRQLGVAKKFGALSENVKGKRIVLIDDSIVRGNTIGPIIKLLRDAGAAEVHIRIASPPLKYPCYMGINIPTREELIANKMDSFKLAEHVGADSLEYLSVEGLVSAIHYNMRTPPDGVGGHCTACLTGDYPGGLPDDVDW